jgi:drug/metabolite transporter (DMT)-like permease
MNLGTRHLHAGAAAALTAAILFGLSTPLAKVLLGGLSPWMLAGLLYLGSGTALAVWRLARRQGRGGLARNEVLPLIGTIGFGGVLAPVLLMFGLSGHKALSEGHCRGRAESFKSCRPNHLDTSL